jgi:hypothetical protein
MLTIFLIFMSLLTLAGAVIGKPANPRNWWARPLLAVVGLLALACAFGLI